MGKKKQVVNIIPPVIPGIDKWLILGLDPSLSCSGYAFMKVEKAYENDAGASPNDPPPAVEGTLASWLDVGSCKPDETKNPVWLRAALMGSYLKVKLDSISSQLRRDHVDDYGDPTTSLGLLICMEYPTPTDDFLNRVNAVFHTLFFAGSLALRFKQIRILTVNASTLRSLFGLVKKGNNKKENISRAYDFLDEDYYPNLDSDACDAALLTMVARHVVSILMGFSSEVPEKFLNVLCDSAPVERGTGKNVRITTKGLLHTTGQRPEYWYSYDRKGYEVAIRDAHSAKKTLTRITFEI